MEFKNNTIAIYSVGLLGGSIGLAFKESGFKGKIIGFSSKSSLQKALDIGCIDEGYGYDEFQSKVGLVDILFLCSPINTIIDTIKKMTSMELPAGIVITDVGSTKLDIINASACLPSHVRFVGGHPMAGSEKSGPSAADPFLFQNAI
jgi:prephenate dehydrogenase